MLQKINKMNGGDINMRNEKGFTLIELLLVILIIGILLALIVPNFSIIQERARQTNVKNNMRIFYVAFGAYATDHAGAFPSTDLEYIEYYLPGGDILTEQPGIYPTNPYSGAPYSDADLDYTTDAWETTEYQMLDEESAVYTDLEPVIGEYGEINIGGYDPGTGTLGVPVGLSIWGYGTNLVYPLLSSGSAAEENRVFFVYYY